MIVFVSKLPATFIVAALFAAFADSVGFSVA